MILLHHRAAQASTQPPAHGLCRWRRTNTDGSLLQEFLWTSDGLSRTERQVLQAAAAGRRKKSDIYLESRKQEETPWGDASVYLRMAWLKQGMNPALAETPKDEFTITDTGRQLLEGQADWIKLLGSMDTWLGACILPATNHNGVGTRERRRW